MWTCHPPMHFSVHRTALTDYYKNKCCDNWPVFLYAFFFSFFSRFWRQRLIRETFKAKDSTKTRTPSLFTAVVFPCLAAACIAHWTIGTFRAAILLAFKLFFPINSVCSAWVHECSRSFREVRVWKKKKEKKQNYTKSSWILKDWGFFFNNTQWLLK